MKLIYLGEELSTEVEHELFSDSDSLGFDVVIIHTDESWYEHKVHELFNFTEVHHLWHKNYMGGPSIAFESDIHQTGFTRLVSNIKKVTITKALTKDLRKRRSSNKIK